MGGVEAVGSIEWMDGIGLSVCLSIYLSFCAPSSLASMMLSACADGREMVSRVLLLVFGWELVKERDEVVGRLWVLSEGVVRGRWEV